MKKKGLVFSAFVLGALLLMGCASATAGSGGGEATGSEQAAEQDLGMVCALIGKDDADTADLLGGGEENWTEDGVTFIGRIYDTELYGEPVTVYTTCSPEKKVDSVSIWLTDGSQAVKEEQLAEWQRSVSYTHLDVYKRQSLLILGYGCKWMRDSSRRVGIPAALKRCIIQEVQIDGRQ